MRQAHALMSKHGLTAEAITQADIGEAQTASRTMARNKPSKWEAALAGLVANAFGCRMLIASMVPKEDAELPKRSQGIFNVGKYIFVGLKNQVEIAAYTAQVLTRKCQKARAAWIKEKCSGLSKKPGGRKRTTAHGDEGGRTSPRCSLVDELRGEGMDSGRERRLAVVGFIVGARGARCPQ